MPCDPKSLSNRTLPARAAIRFVGLLVFVTVALSGCATMQMPASIFQTSTDDSISASTVRSQNDGQSFDWGTDTDTDTDTESEPVFANYGTMQSRFSSSPDISAVEKSLNIVAPGHSFAQPRARLGRPIMLVESVNKIDGTQESQGDDEIPPSDAPVPMEGSSDVGRRQVNRSPWTSKGRSAWQPVRPANPMSPKLVQRSEGGKVPTEESTSGSEASGNFSDLPRQIVTSAEPITEGSSSEKDVDATRTVENELSSQIDGQISEATPGPAESIPAQDQGMLSRLRSLYAPRIVEDNTSKVRKQLRNWSDPFNPFKGKEQSEPLATPGNAEPVETEGTKTADVSSPDSPSISPDSPLTLVVQDLERELQEWPKSPSGKPERPIEWRQQQTDLRLLYMVSGRSAEAVRVIDSLPEEEQEFWQSLMMSMNQYRASGIDSTRAEQLTESLDSLRTAAKKLQPLSKLAVRRLMFCDRIDGFGNVNALPTSDFNPGQRVLVYAEVQNFRSELTAEGDYRTEFAALIEFMKEGDDEVSETIRLPQILDRCDVERTDYFHSFELTLPALEGSYVVRIRLRDQLSLQTTESQLNFNVRSENSGL